MKATDLIDNESLRDDIPAFAPGDEVKVHVRVVEGNKERVQVFQGTVIRRATGESFFVDENGWTRSAGALSAGEPPHDGAARGPFERPAGQRLLQRDRNFRQDRGPPSVV